MSYEQNRVLEQVKEVGQSISDFLSDHGIEHDMESAWTEKEWTDFRVIIVDSNQMERINKWLKDDLKNVIKGWSDIEISAPNTMTEREDELRIRVYGLV